jgi:hypothetical protein
MNFFRSSPFNVFAPASLLHTFIFSCWVIGAVREPDDLLASAAAVGGERRARGPLAGLSQRTQRPTEDSLE